MTQKKEKLNSCLVGSDAPQGALNDARMEGGVFGVGMDSGAGFRLGSRNDGPLLRHPEERSDVRVLGQVGSVVGSRGPHGAKAPQDDGEKSVCVMSPHALRAQDNKERKKGSGRRASGEQGRSMVEMLGTLAIMGVLSIGGVAGYRYAVDKANANAILDGVNKRAVIVSQQRIVGQEVNLSEFEADIKGAYPTTAEIYADNQFFAVLVDKVPQGVCDHILREKTRFASDVFVSTGAGTGVDDCPEGESMIEFTFANDFNAGEQLEWCTAKSDCASACEDCQNGVCVESCPTRQACAKKRGLSWGYSKANQACCPTERIVNGTCCNYVAEDANGDKLCCQDANKTKCCPPGQFYIRGACHSCDESVDAHWVDMALCEACPNRFQIGDWTCALNCPDPDQIEWNGRCLCPNDRPIATQQGTCVACGNSGIWAHSFVGMLDLDENPSGGTFLVGYCGNMRASGGYVNPCPTEQIGGVRVTLTNGTQSSSNVCHSCNEVQIDKLQFKSQCEICGGTWTGESWWKGTCTPPEE